MLNFDFEQKRNYSIYLSYAKKKNDQLLKKKKKQSIHEQKRNYSIYLFSTKKKLFNLFILYKITQKYVKQIHKFYFYTISTSQNIKLNYKWFIG